MYSIMGKIYYTVQTGRRRENFRRGKENIYVEIGQCGDIYITDTTTEGSFIRGQCGIDKILYQVIPVFIKKK